jgi:hypothetical protein
LGKSGREARYVPVVLELIEIADNPENDAASVNRDWLKIDARKWILAKAFPRSTATISPPR